MTAGMADLGWNTQPEPRRRRRWPRNLVIGLLVLVGLLVAADRIAVSVAETKVAERIQNSQNLPERPALSITGFPFLTQALAKKFDKVTFDARGLVRNNVRITDFHAELRDLTLSSGFKPESAARVDVTALFSYADLEAAAAAQGLNNLVIADGGNGDLKISGDVKTPLGTTVKATLMSKLSLGPNNKVILQASKVETNVPGLNGTIPRDLDYNIPVGVLPLGTQLHDFQVGPDGVRVSATAVNVPITSSGLGST